MDPDFPLDATRVLLSCRGQCSQCNLGYYLDSDTEKCTPWPCRDAVPQFSAPFPRRFLQNHRNFHQAFLPSPLLLSLKCLVSLSQEAMAPAARLARRRLIEQPLISSRSATPDINSMRMAVAIPSSALRWVWAIPARHVGNRQIAGQTTNVLNATWDFA